MRPEVKFIIDTYAKPKSFDTAFDAGYDCAINGANTNNCDFRWFSSKASMEEWTRGNKEGKAK